MNLINKLMTRNSKPTPFLFRSGIILFASITGFILLGFVLGGIRVLASGLMPPGNPDPFPAPNAPAVPITASVGIGYDEPINPATVNTRTFVVHALQSGQILATYGVHGGRIFLTPTTPFRPGELVFASATTGTLSAIDGTGPLTPTVWQFNAAAPAGAGQFIPSDTDLGDDTAMLVVGDVDQDGDLDVVLGNGSSPSEVWLNEPDPQTGYPGTFVLGQDLGTYDTWDVDLGDLDGDGDLDIFIVNVDQPNAVWINLGGMQGGPAGVFTDSLQILGTNSTTGVALGDLDGDGDLDAATNRWNGLPGELWINTGGLQGGLTGVFTQSSQLFPNNNGRDIAIGDVDNDGDLDVITAVWNGGDIVWLNNGDATFVNSGQNLGFSFANTLVMGDVDNDGDLDVFVATDNNQVDLLWLNQGGLQGGTTGTFAAGTSVFTNTSTRQGVMGDVNGDGSLDLIASGRNGADNIIWLNDGAGFFSITNTVLIADNEDSYAIAAGDVNNDDDLDLIVGYNFSSGPNAVWRNNSAPLIQSVNSPATVNEGTPITIGVTISSTDSPAEMLRLEVDWGDGTTTTLDFPAADNELTLPHTYANNRPGEEPYTIQLLVVDQEEGQDSADVAIEVTNVPPTLLDWSLTDPVSEGGSALLSGEMFDPGLDELVLSLNWGEGMQEVHEFPAGTTTFSFTHTYLDDNPTGTPSDPYTVSMILVDEDLDLDQGEAHLAVHNLVPKAAAGPDQTVDLGMPVHLQGQFDDPGVEDSHVYWWDLGNGTFITGTLTLTHTYEVSGVFTVTLFVLDDDTGLATSHLLVTVLEPVISESLHYLPVVLNKP